MIRARVVVLAALALSISVAVVAVADGPFASQSSGTTSDLNGVAFVDAKHGWAVGAAGTILATSDGGATWAPQTSGTTQDLQDVAFADATHGWAVGGTGTVLATTDGGATWQSQPTPTTQTLWAVDALDPLHAVTVGGLGTVLITADGGASWPPHGSGSSAAYGSVSFPDASHGWITTDSGHVLASADGGGTWTQVTSTTFDEASAVTFTDPAHGWVADYYLDLSRPGLSSNSFASIKRTSDGGKHWTAKSLGIGTPPVNGLSFADADHGWAVGDRGLIEATSDGGATWTAQASPTTDNLEAVSIADPYRGAAVGKAGRVVTGRLPVPSGSLTVAPTSGAPASEIGVSSETPCPGGAPAVDVMLTRGDTVIASTAGQLDASGNWRATLTVPAATPNGAVFVTATCTSAYQHGRSTSLQYPSVPFTVAGPQPAPIPLATSTMTSTANPPGTANPTTTPRTPTTKPTATSSHCTALKHGRSNCDIAYTFGAASTADASIVAVATRKGVKPTSVNGSLKKHTVKLRFLALKPGVYSITIRVRRTKKLVGRTTLTVNAGARRQRSRALRITRSGLAPRSWTS